MVLLIINTVIMNLMAKIIEKIAYRFWTILLKYYRKQKDGQKTLAFGLKQVVKQVIRIKKGCRWWNT